MELPKQIMLKISRKCRLRLSRGAILAALCLWSRDIQGLDSWISILKKSRPFQHTKAPEHAIGWRLSPRTKARRGTRLEDAEFQPICCSNAVWNDVNVHLVFPFLDLEQMASSYSSYSFLLATFLFQPLNPLKWLLNIHALYLQNFYPCTYADCACVRGVSIDRIIGRQRRASHVWISQVRCLQAAKIARSGETTNNYHQNTRGPDMW